MWEVRANRMIERTPYEYHYSRVFQAIINAPAQAYESVEMQNADLQKQLYILTATWGLKYWEEQLVIPTIEADGYEIRRSRVLSKWRGVGKFSKTLIKSVAEAYSNGEVEVSLNSDLQEITIKFVSTIGVPPNMDDLKAILDNIVHAHLGIKYVLSYYTVAAVNAMTIDYLQSLELRNFAPFSSGL